MDNSYISIMVQMCWRIKHKCTGGPVNFSKKLGISKSTFYSRKDTLNHFGANIRFSKEKNTYYFEEDIGEFIAGFGKKTEAGYLIPFDKIVDE